MRTRLARGSSSDSTTTGIERPPKLYSQYRDRHGAACGDFDNDGDDDLFITQGAKRGETGGIKFDAMLSNQGEFTFEEITARSGTRNTHGRARLPTWVDYDLDGLLDLYIGNFQSGNVLNRNRGDVTFEDVSAWSKIGIVESTHQAWSDFDADGDPDLVLVWPVKAFRNDGVDGFTDVTAQLGFTRHRVGTPSSIVWGDFDNDTRMDVFIVSRRGDSKLYRNETGGFVPLPSRFGPEDEDERRGARAGDIDNDGDLDLILVSVGALYFLENVGSGVFKLRELAVDPEFRPGKGADIALGDYDGDGYLDLAVNGDDGKRLLRNTGAGNAWLKVALEGNPSNRSGFGARITARAGALGAVVREHFGAVGVFKSVGCGPVHLGLAKANSVDLEIRWPSGIVQAMKGIGVRQTITVNEPGER